MLPVPYWIKQTQYFFLGTILKCLCSLVKVREIQNVSKVEIHFTLKYEHSQVKTSEIVSGKIYRGDEFYKRMKYCKNAIG